MMLLSLAVSCAIAFQGNAAAKCDVAYVARYYGSGSESTTYQVYLTDTQGKNTIRISDSKRNYGSVQWLNTHQVAFIEQGDLSDALHIYDTKTAEDKTIKQFAKSERATLTLHPYIGVNTCLVRTGTAPYSYFNIFAENVTRVANPPTSAFQYTNRPVAINALGQSTFLSRVEATSKTTLRWVFARGALTIDVPSGLSEGFFEAYQSKVADQVWVVIWSGNGQIGYRNDLYLLDFKKVAATPIVTDVQNIKFHVDMRYWAAVSSYNRYIALSGGTKVKVNTGIVGDRSSNKRWTVTSGNCFVKSISLQPGM